MTIKLKNNATGLLATSISASDTGLVLQAGNGAAFSALGAGEYFYATLVSAGGTLEIVKVTARVGDTMTVVRAQEGTSAAGFAAGSRLEQRVTAQSVFDAVGDVVASQVGFTPTGGIAATDVQAALAGVDSEKVAFTRLDDSDGSSLVGFLQAGTGAVATTVQAKLRETVSVKDFGAVGDGVVDDTAAIQAAIDATIYNGSSNQANGLKHTVYIPAGTYRITDTIHLGYGVSFNSVTVEGAGYQYGSNLFNGTRIVADFDDRPAFNFQGSRGSVLRNLGISGKTDSYYIANQFGSGSSGAPLLDDTNPANWDDPSLPATQDSRYAPYAAITVDAYSGVRPATSYPDVTYPAYLGAVAQYNKNFSSKILIENVFIRGFIAGIAVQPCDADGNADFITIRGCTLQYVKWGISVGNSQSRNVHIESLNAAVFYALLTNSTHGRRIGRFGGEITDASVVLGINIFVFGDGARLGPVTFTNLYFESTWRIGSLTAGSTNEEGIIFNSCTFKFDNQTAKRGIPSNVIDLFDERVCVEFNNCVFGRYPSVVGLSGNLNNCVFFPTERLTKPADSSGVEREYVALCHNATNGGAVFDSLFPLQGPQIARFKLANTSALSSLPVERRVSATDPYFYSARNYCIPFIADAVGVLNDYFRQYVRHDPAVIAKSTLASCSLTNRTLTFSFSSRTDYVFASSGPDVGDVIFDTGSRATFFVRSRTGLTVIAEMQNNYKDDGLGGYTTVTPFDPSTGNFYVGNGRRYSLSRFVYGDVTSGSAVITNCQRPDGSSANLSEILVDDWINLNIQDVYGSATLFKITNVDSGAKTITLSGNLSLTATKVPLMLFWRKAAANV